jgi:hypothetical protein
MIALSEKSHRRQCRCSQCRVGSYFGHLRLVQALDNPLPPDVAAVLLRENARHVLYGAVSQLHSGRIS